MKAVVHLGQMQSTYEPNQILPALHRGMVRPFFQRWKWIAEQKEHFTTMIVLLVRILLLPSTA
jgi:hypothetical protein